MNMQDLLYERRGSVAILAFNRPDRLNACRWSTYRELHTALGEVGSDRSVRVLILGGRGRAFCAGDDLDEAGALLAARTSESAWREMGELLQDITRRLVALPQPVIAAVQGHAVGFGFELAAASDLRVVSENAVFRFSEVKHGLYVTNGVLHLLPQIVGRGRATEWLLTGEPVAAREAQAAGFVSRLVPPERLLEVAVSLADTLSGNAPITLRLLKQHLRVAAEQGLEGALRLELDGLLTCLASGDVEEGVRAFTERRPPSFRGE